MQKKPAVSSTDSFFFQLHPHYFRVDHGFAKTIKPNTTYRLSVYKGIQKADQMAEPIKGKLVGGKIIFDQTPLSFSLPLYSPTRNIEFTIKVLQTKPNEPEAQIAQHKIKSGDFIKTFKNQNLSLNHQQANLVDNLALVFDLFVHNSKIQLDKIVQQHQQQLRSDNRNNILNNRGKTPKKNQPSSEIYSQSENASETGSANREGGMFASKKKLIRRRGHDGKLKSSKHGSREGSEVGSQRSRSRSQKSFGPFPHNEQNEHFVRSPKKASPPKVDQPLSPSASQAKLPKGQNLVAVNRKENQHSEIKNQRPSNATPPKATKVSPNIQRSQSAKRAQRSNILEINTPATDRKGPISRKSQVHQLEVKTEQPMFDIKKKSTEKVKSPEKSQPQKQKTETPATNRKQPISRKSQGIDLQIKTKQPMFDIGKRVSASGVKSPEKDQTDKPKQESLPPLPNRSSAKNSIPKTPAKAEPQTEPIDQPISKPSQISVKKQTADNHAIQNNEQAEHNQQIPAKTTQKQNTGAEASVKSKGSRNGVPVIQVKGKPVIDQNERDAAEVKMKTSVRLTTQEKEQDIEQSAGKEYQGMKNKVFYVLFVIISLFLFWNAITPSRRV